MNVPITHYGISDYEFLLYRTDYDLHKHTFLYAVLLDPYIRKFVRLIKVILTMSIL